MEESRSSERRPDGAPSATLALVDELRSAVAADFGTERMRAPSGWVLGGVAARRFRRWVPVVTLRRGTDTLCFIVTPSDPAEPAFSRTPRHDVTYFSEDVPNDEQDRIYQRDRDMIDAFAGWLGRRDGAAAQLR